MINYNENTNIDYDNLFKNFLMANQPKFGVLDAYNLTEKYKEKA